MKEGLSYGIYGDPDGMNGAISIVDGPVSEHNQGLDAYGGDLYGNPEAFVKPHPSEMPHRKVTEAQRLGFHRDAVIPQIPEGMQLVKVSGEPAVIPVTGDEPIVDGSQFTRTQLHAISELVAEKRAAQIPASGDIYLG